MRYREQIRGVAGGDQSSSAQEDGWVICRVFKKKHLIANHHQAAAQGSAGATVAKLGGGAVVMERSPSNCSSTVTTVSEHAKATQIQQQQPPLLHYSASDDALDHILNHYMAGRSTTCKQETKPSAMDHLITNTTGGTLYERFMKLPPLEHVLPPPPTTNPAEYGTVSASGNTIGADWDALDRLAAYELNGLSDTKTNGAAMSFFVDEHVSVAGDGDLWSLARSVSSALHADLTAMNE